MLYLRWWLAHRDRPTGADAGVSRTISEEHPVLGSAGPRRAHVGASGLMKAFTPTLRNKHPSSGPHMRVGAF
jgi:hypothetical protein